MVQIISKQGEAFEFRKLRHSDAAAFGHFLESLSHETRSRFGPHPLTKEYALQLCDQANDSLYDRFIIAKDDTVAGYFILDYSPAEPEETRYKTYGIQLNTKTTPRIAPCIADDYQNAGIASKAMQAIITFAKDKGLTGIVLMGGTQGSNAIARAFYTKFKFETYGEFYTEMNNIDMMLSFK